MITNRVRSVSELALKVAGDPQLAEDIKANPAETIAQIAEPLKSDVWIYRIVVSALGLVVIITIAGSIVLVSNDKEVPDVLVSIGSAAIGALAGLLAPPPT